MVFYRLIQREDHTTKTNRTKSEEDRCSFKRQRQNVKNMKSTLKKEFKSSSVKQRQRNLRAIMKVSLNRGQCQCTPHAKMTSLAPATKEKITSILFKSYQLDLIPMSCIWLYEVETSLSKLSISLCYLLPCVIS